MLQPFESSKWPTFSSGAFSTESLKSLTTLKYSHQKLPKIAEKNTAPRHSHGCFPAVVNLTSLAFKAYVLIVKLHGLFVGGDLLGFCPDFLSPLADIESSNAAAQFFIFTQVYPHEMLNYLNSSFLPEMTFMCENLTFMSKNRTLMAENGTFCKATYVGYIILFFAFTKTLP